MDAVLNVSYSQILSLIMQMPVRTRLRLGKALTRDATREELQYFLDTFRTDELLADDVLTEVKQVRKERYEHLKKKTDNR